MAAHFQLEQELQWATRLDTPINISLRHGRPANKSTPSRSNSSSNTGSSVMGNTSRLLSAVSTSLMAQSADKSFGQGRSLSVSRLTPSKARQGSVSCSRGPSPSRAGPRPRANSTGRCVIGGDRFIPNRLTTDDQDVAHHSLVQGSDTNLASDAANSSDQENESSESAHSVEALRKMTADLLIGGNTSGRILSFKVKPPAPDEAHASNLKVLYSTGKPKASQSSKVRHIPSRPDKILDAPDLVDDFYLHHLDWSANNHLAVALGNYLFVWNATDGNISELLSRESEDDIICSVSWIKEGNVLAVGDKRGPVELWDVSKMKRLRTMSGHTDRVAVMDWNSYILASGCRSGQVHLHDVRAQQHCVTRLEGHTQEVCGMAWSPDNGRLLATGSNDNLVLVWDSRDTAKPLFTFSAHLAAVKAVSWCPWQPKVLSTGGGTFDHSIKFWNTNTGVMLQSKDANSQVSSIVWNEEYKELVTGHGFSQNLVSLWKFPSMSKVIDLQGHTSRVLLLLPSPDNTTVASAAGDETIRLWKIWPATEKKMQAKRSKEPTTLFAKNTIR